MCAPGSISRWITAFKQGNDEAAQPLWRRYHRQLAALARKVLHASRRTVADEEDVVQAVFHSFFRALSHGRFPELSDRNGLERLLVVITANKAIRQLKYEQRKKRSAASPATGESAFLDEDEALRQVLSPWARPDLAAQAADEYQQLLARLGDDSLRQVAEWKMQGYSNEEIAAQLRCSLRTVARKLEAIRLLWRKQLAG